MADIAAPNLSGSPSTAREPSRLYAYYVVGVLMVAYMFAFVDRLVLSLVVDPMRQDLGLSETQISLLAGFAFAMFYTVLGLPFGRWVDTRGRRNIIALGMVLWSAATVACGLANSFWRLFAARTTVGVGEATLSPAAYSLIADYFPPHRRGLAMAIFASGITIGGGLATMFGGFVVQWATETTPTLPLLGQLAPWRFTFLAVGLPGVFVGILVWLTVREPPRRLEPGSGDPTPSIAEVVGYLNQHRKLFALVFVGFSGIVITGYAYNVWGPSYFIRVHGLTPADVGVLYGFSMALAATIGVLVGGVLSDRLAKAGWSDAPLRVSLVSAVLQAPLFIACYLSADRLWAQLFFAAALFFGSLYGGLQGVAVQSLASNRMRGQVAALYLTTANLIGLGLAPTLIALMTENVFGGPQGVGRSLATAVAVSLTMAIILLWLSLKPARARADALLAPVDAPAPVGVPAQ